jgi:hypothetical protein
MQRPRSRTGILRAVALALLVAIAGAGAGAGGFAYENAHQVWRPQVTHTGSGWTVRQRTVGGPVAPAIHWPYMVWGWGADTILMDLRSGDTRLLGSGTRNTFAMPPDISDSYADWTLGVSPLVQTHNLTTFAYGLSSGRRFRLPGDVRSFDTPALDGSVVVWVDQKGAVRAYDLETGTRSLVAQGPARGSLLAGDGRVAWYPYPRDGNVDSATLLVRDMTDGGRTVLVPPPSHDPTLTGSVGWTALSNGYVAGLGADPGRHDLEVLVRSIDTGATRVVGTAWHEVPPAAGSGWVAWFAPDPAGTGAILLAERLAGGPAVRLARVPEGSPLTVGGGWVAWTARGPRDTIITTMPLP